MGNSNHEWILKFRHYEAVLRCTHELGAWDREQTLRAYQTFGFDDATTNGNDLSFSHIDTGVMVLHDGDVVAIQYGEGEMVKALADLFTTLNGLGWTKAEVFHPQESMDALLMDMGKAIPGHLNFDVHPSRDSSSAAENSVEAEEVMELGLSLMQGVASNAQEAQEFNRGALMELKSMADEEQALLNAPIYSQLDTPLELDDGLDAYASGQPPQSTVQTNPSDSAPAPHTDRVYFADDEDSLPIVPTLGGQPTAEVVPVSAPIQLVEDREPNALMSQAFNEHSAAEVNLAEQPSNQSPETASSGAPLQPAIAASEASESSEQQTIVTHRPATMGAQAVQIAPVVRKQVDAEIKPLASAVANFTHLTLGRSAICFDLPEAPLEQCNIEEVAQRLKMREVVHVWPGLTNQPERWDLLAEIDPSAPWFAETIADELRILKPVERILFAGALKKASEEGMQLRALLMALLGGEWAPDALVKVTKNSIDSNGLTEAVFGKLGALLLCEEGECFLDTKPVSASGDSKYPTTFSILSARAISQDAAAKLYVVHLDACDGPFVRNIVMLMMEVAHRYSTSMRNTKKAEAQKALAVAEEARQQEIKRQAAVQKTQEMLSALATHMKDAGLDLHQVQSLMPT